MPKKVSQFFLASKENDFKFGKLINFIFLYFSNFWIKRWFRAWSCQHFHRLVEQRILKITNQIVAGVKNIQQIAITKIFLLTKKVHIIYSYICFEVSNNQWWILFDARYRVWSVFFYFICLDFSFIHNNHTVVPTQCLA